MGRTTVYKYDPLLTLAERRTRKRKADKSRNYDRVGPTDVVLAPIESEDDIGGVRDAKAKIKGYFDFVEETAAVPSVHGLAAALGMSDAKVLKIYHSEDVKYAERQIQKATLRIAVWWETKLGGPQPTGAIFWLKNVAKWSDKQEMDITSGGQRLGNPSPVILPPTIAAKEVSSTPFYEVIKRPQLGPTVNKEVEKN